MPLPHREEEILAAIEDDLTWADPQLAKILTSMPTAGTRREMLPITLRLATVLTAGLALLAALHNIAGSLHPAVTAALTGLLSVAWLTRATRAAQHLFPAPWHIDQSDTPTTPRRHEPRPRPKLFPGERGTAREPSTEDQP
jgi:hypothetical protein